jgi:hypothetical protein
LTDWLLQQVPAAPYCHLVNAIQENDAVVYYRAADSLQSFDAQAEIERSRRYWSSAFPDDSFERMQGFGLAQPGSIVADPRTFHPTI